MTLSALPVPILLPGYTRTPAVTSATVMTLDASGERAAFIWTAPKTGNIRKVWFRTGSVTGATDTDVRVETVGATTGDPSGTLWGANTNATVASASITANTWVQTDALTADAAVTRGDVFALVIAPSGSPNFQVARGSGGPTDNTRFYASHLTASWTKYDQGVYPSIFPEYSDGSIAVPFPDMVIGITALNSTFNTGSTPDEVALKVTLGPTMRAIGMYAALNAPNDYDLVLYSSDGSTVLESVATDKDLKASTGGRFHLSLFDTSVTLSAGGTYYLAVKPTSGSNVPLYYYDAPSADAAAACSLGYWSARTDAGSWSDTTTRVPYIGLVVDAMDDGAGGGSGGEGPLVSGRLVQ